MRIFLLISQLLLTACGSNSLELEVTSHSRDTITVPEIQLGLFN